MMFRPTDINSVFTFADTLTIPATFLTIVTLIHEGLNHFDGIYFPIDGLPGADGARYLDFHRNLNDMTNAIIRYSERVLSIGATDPLITTADTLARYQNLLVLHGYLETIHHHTQDLISSTLDIDFSQIGEYRRAYDVLLADGDRLRLAGNTLVRVLRYLEGILVEDNPAFQILPTQWFEE